MPDIPADVAPSAYRTSVTVTLSCMFGTFTDDAREIIAGAQLAAERDGAGAVTARHILAAIAEGAPQLLTLDVATTERLRLRARESAAPSRPRRGLLRGRQARFSRDAQRVFESALQESRRLDTAAIGPAVLLLGVIAAREAGDLMQEVGVDAVVAQREAEQAVTSGS